MRWLLVVLAACGRLDFHQGAYCADLDPQPPLCDDFDGDVDPWTDAMTNNGTYALSGGLSPPHALAVTTSTIAAGDTANVYRRVRGLGTTPRATVAFDV